VWGERETKIKRERERSGGRETDRELSKLFIFYHHSTIASIFQSQTESLTNFVKNSSFIFSSKRKKKGVFISYHFYFFTSFCLSLSVPSSCRSPPPHYYYYTFSFIFIIFFNNSLTLTLTNSLYIFVCSFFRRPQGNPLDLNNLPDDYSRDHGKQVLEDTDPPGN
jgi:hypothetical protein